MGLDVAYLVFWAQSTTVRIISGLKNTCLKSYIVERTNKAELRPQEQSEKKESRRENLWKKYSWKGHKDRNRHRNRIKRSGKARLVYVWHKPQHPHHVKVSAWGLLNNNLRWRYLRLGFQRSNNRTGSPRDNSRIQNLPRQLDTHVIQSQVSSPVNDTVKIPYGRMCMRKRQTCRLFTRMSAFMYM